MSDYFATHGLAAGDLDRLDQPALALSNPKLLGEYEDDGLLTVDEIVSLRLNADWSVLSACNTGGIDGHSANAVSGLSRAFLYAGSRSLLVSSWPVHSQATKELTTRLFEARADRQGGTRSEAARQARLFIIDNGVERDAAGRVLYSYAHPIFWAPFIVVGDGRGG